MIIRNTSVAFYHYQFEEYGYEVRPSGLEGTYTVPLILPGKSFVTHIKSVCRLVKMFIGRQCQGSPFASQPTLGYINSTSSTPFSILPIQRHVMASYLPDSCTIQDTIPFVTIIDMNSDILVLDPATTVPGKPLLRQARIKNCKDIIALRNCLNSVCSSLRYRYIDP